MLTPKVIAKYFFFLITFNILFFAKIQREKKKPEIHTELNAIKSLDVDDPFSVWLILNENYNAVY